jgi:hypothetical protein
MGFGDQSFETGTLPIIVAFITGSILVGIFYYLTKSGGSGGYERDTAATRAARRQAGLAVGGDNDEDDDDAGEGGGAFDIFGRGQNNSRYAEKQAQRDFDRKEKARQNREEREAREREQQAEYDQWIKSFTIEDEGVAAPKNAPDNSIVGRFVRTIKNRKVVNLEDLSSEFSLRTDDIVKRINDLQGLGQLSGVFDDRGKYIYITQEELEEVVKYIDGQGRVSIRQLARACNRIIRLEPDEEGKKEEEEKARAAVQALDGVVGQDEEEEQAAAASAAK